MARYVPGQLEAKNVEDLRQVVERELRAISEAFEPETLELQVMFREPEKRFRGLVVYADGTSWNPGSGEGIYRHTGAAWIFVG